jgi:hypothetical protein
VGLLGLLSSSVAFAQPLPSESPETPVEHDPAAAPAPSEEPTPPTPPEPPAEIKALAKYFGISSKEVPKNTDHFETLGSFGWQIGLTEVTDSETGAPATVPFIGIRRWTSRMGYEIAIGANYLRENDETTGMANSAVVLGGTYGFLYALGIHRHMTVFVEPQGTFMMVVPDDDSAAKNTYLTDARCNIGAEIRLGMIGLPQIGLTAKFAAGVRFSNQGKTDVFLGTTDDAATGIKGLLQSKVGFIFYM